MSKQAIPFGDDGTSLSRGHVVFVCGTDDLGSSDCGVTGWVQQYYRIDSSGFVGFGGNGSADDTQVFVRKH